MKYTEEQITNVENFLTEWSIIKKLEAAPDPWKDEDYQVPPEAEKAFRERAAKDIAPFDENIEVGQVRLLADLPEATNVVVLRKWPEGWLVSTFSHFDYPALEGELKLPGDHGLYLNVVQAWNTRTLRDRTLARSWVQGRLAPTLVKEVFDLWAHTLDGRTLPEQLIARTGCGIEDPDDPRVEYMQRSLQVFAELDLEDLAD